MRIDVLGVGFDNVTMEEAIDRGMELLHSQGCHYVVTPNPEIVEVCRENPAACRAVGAKPGVAKMAGEKLAQAHPGLRIAGTHDGYFQEDAPVVEEIRQSGADAVFVCLGAPKQELWMEKNGPATGARLLCGLGGSLDIFSGTTERAPKFWSDHGLEWLYRLCREPRRIGRMMKLPLFLVHVKQEKRRR